MENEMYKSLLDGLFEGVYFVDRERRITYWNKAAERITGYTGDGLLGQGCREGTLCHIDEAGRHLCEDGCPLSATMKDGQRRTAHVFVHHADGHRVPVRVAASPIVSSTGEIVGAIESFVEDSEWRAATSRNAELEELAYVDELTRLPNRRYIEQRLDSKLEDFARYGWPCGILLVDIDHFKAVNDTHGHDIGDRVLERVGHSLHGGLRGSDVVGRWGGEEFLVVVSNATAQTLTLVAERLRSLVEASYLSTPVRIGATISLGAALARSGETAAELLRRADENLYRAKRGGRNAVCADDG